MHICACTHNLAAGEAAVMRAADAGCERQAGLPKRLRTQPGTPKPLSGRRRARRGAEGPGARKKRRHPSRFRTMQQQNSISGSKRTARQIKETDRPIRFFLFCFFIDFCCCFCVFNALFYMFFMRFLYVFYAFFMCFSCFVRPLRVYRFCFYTILHIYQCLSGFARCRSGMHHIGRVSGLDCRSDMHQRGRTFLTNFSLPAI